MRISNMGHPSTGGNLSQAVILKSSCSNLVPLVRRVSTSISSRSLTSPLIKPTVKFTASGLLERSTVYVIFPSGPASRSVILYLYRDDNGAAGLADAKSVLMGDVSKVIIVDGLLPTTGSYSFTEVMMMSTRAVAVRLGEPLSKHMTWKE